MPNYDFFSDEQLVKASRDGQDAAWEALLRRHGQRLLAFFCRMNGGDLSVAKERWLSLWSDLARQRPSLATGARFSTAAFGLALKLSQTTNPQRLRQPRTDDPSSFEARSARFYTGLAELPANERAALCLGYLDNLPWEELGRVMGCRGEEARDLCAAAYAHLDANLGSDFLTAGL
jgi:DNA-directed RNA polymerase specialized sigma24 family protein